MNILVVGGDGLIGKAVCKHVTVYEEEVEHFLVTTRRSTSAKCEGIAYLDLLKPQAFSIRTKFHIAFLCAGINGFKQCEGNETAWHTNVDGVLTVAMRLIKECGTFVVYPSTQAVGWSSSDYARQRAQVEAVLLSTWNAAIIRVGRVGAHNCRDCAKALYMTGLRFQAGIYYWE